MFLTNTCYLWKIGAQCAYRRAQLNGSTISTEKKSHRRAKLKWNSVNLILNRNLNKDVTYSRVQLKGSAISGIIHQKVQPWKQCAQIVPSKNTLRKSA